MAINPMEFFTIGQRIGQTKSPVMGIGGAIRNILKNAQAMGLVRAQAGAQGIEARRTATFKDQLERERGAETVDQPIVGPGGRIKTIKARRDAPRPITEPATNIFSMMGDQGGGVGDLPSNLSPENIDLLLDQVTSEIRKLRG